MRVRARRSLLRSGLFAAIAAGVPLFVVLYWLSIAQGSWLRVLMVQVIYVGFFVLLFLRHFGAFVEVTPSTVTKQAMIVRTVVARADVASLHVADTYGSSAPDLIPQLLALDANGQRMFRMRGTFWSREDMLTVADAIGAPLTVEPEPLPIKEYYALRPGIAYWYEGKLWITLTGIVLAFGVAYLAVSWLMSAIGVPSVLSLPL